MSFARPRPLRRAPFLEDLHPPQGGRTAQVELILFSRATSRRGHARATFYDKRGAIQRFLILNAPPFGLDAQLAPLFEGPDRLLGRGSVNVNSRPTQELRMPPRSPRRTSTPKKLTLRDVPPSAAYPPISALRRLITELDQANSQPPVLSALDVQSYPQPLGACHVLNVGEIKDSSFVLSQSRSDGKGYISVAGQRRETAASAKSWPRTPSGRTKKLVNLHRWILLATRQQPPGRDYEASHVCGNSRCILAAHLRWQRRHTNNVLDRRFHSDTYTGTVRYSRLTWGVSESYK